jgi:lipopolysaccharide transport system ATP-binding protein
MSCSQAAIQVAGLGKCYRVYDRPQDRLKQSVVPRLRSIAGRPPVRYYREFWALRNVSFEVQRGETVGILGRNGSGKSTLLQIVAGILTPTEGRVTARGRIAALLELGSGFNPEFTGRENVHLNASLLGLDRRQVEERFDSIAEFADIGAYLDQPVKTYSSGMILRLAFAVQVTVDADVLIIDEALAVGDARFQLKCFRRLEELKAAGSTILFVSHDTEVVRSFCDHGMVLENGSAIFWGDARAATVTYLAALFPEQSHLSAKARADTVGGVQVSAPAEAGGRSADGWLRLAPADRITHTFGVGGAKLESIEIAGLDPPNLLIGGRRVIFRCRFSWDLELVRSLIEAQGYARNITVGIALADKKGSYLFGCNGFDAGLAIDCLQDGHGEVEFRIVLPHLAPGSYFLSAAIALGDLDHHVQLKWHDCILELKYSRSETNVFGLLAVEYEMDAVASGGRGRE